MTVGTLGHRSHFDGIGALLTAFGAGAGWDGAS